MSPPGLLAGYDFDTLGTRLGLEFPARGVLLSRIGRYKNLVWLVDFEGATYQSGDDQTVRPVTALWSMSGPGSASTLSAYTQLGGRVWMAGGGSAFASLTQFDRRANNVGQNQVFSSDPRFGELVPSRIMYDGAHWQSAMSVTRGLITTSRREYEVRFNHSNGVLDSTHVVVAPPWSHYDPYSGGTLSSPDYTKLPAAMRLKSALPDPLPPTRTSTQGNLFYTSSLPCEYLIANNSILEDMDPDPEVVGQVAVLDTLFTASSVVLLTNTANELVPAATMTYYHGNGAHQFVFTGFSPWSYARQDCMGLVDFVLQDLWGLTRQPIDRSLPASSIRSPGGTPVRVVSPAPRTATARGPTKATRE